MWGDYVRKTVSKPQSLENATANANNIHQNVYIAFPRLQRAHSINFILVLRGGLFEIEGALYWTQTNNQQSIRLRFHLSAQPFYMACNWACLIALLKFTSQLFTTSPQSLLHLTTMFAAPHLDLYNFMIRSILRPDMGEAAEVAPALTYQQTSLALSFLEVELLLSRTWSITFYHCTLVLELTKGKEPLFYSI